MSSSDGRISDRNRQEPRLGEMLSDPIVQAIMRRDGVSRRDVWQVIEGARKRAEINCTTNGGEKSHA